MIKTKKLNKYNILYIVNILKKLRISTYLLIPLLFFLLVLPKQLIYISILTLLFYSISKLYENKPYKSIEVDTEPFNNVETTNESHESKFKDTLFINQIIDKKEHCILHNFKVHWKIYLEEMVIDITTVKLFYYDNGTIAKIYVFDNSIDIYFDDSITLEMLYYKLQECSSFSDLSSL
ncbi:hypothetical protein ACWTV9_19095 [Clostridioides difficile]